ncbi:MAG: glycosyltransferase family 2 protein [Gemmatimonadaceae bacterium]
MSSISVVVPVYNSEDCLLDLCGRLAKVLPGIGPQFEVIFVNDGSRDGSWGVVDSLAREFRWVRGINLMRNYGQHNAVLCGVRAARHDVIVTMDDDLQHPPEEIPALIRKLREGHDVVYGTPLKEQHGFLRDLASRITKIALRSTMGVEVARKVSAFRALRAPLRQAFSSYHSTFVSIDVLLTWGTTRFAAVPVRHEPRKIGASNYRVRQLVTHALNMLTGFSTLPLQLASLVGFVFTLFGICVLGYVLGRYIVDGGSVAGFPFLASIIAILSGAQLFALGIIGEYLARMHFRMMERPPYAIAVSTSLHDTEP